MTSGLSEQRKTTDEVSVSDDNHMKRHGKIINTTRTYRSIDVHLKQDRHGYGGDEQAHDPYPRPKRERKNVRIRSFDVIYLVHRSDTLPNQGKKIRTKA